MRSFLLVLLLGLAALPASAQMAGNTIGFDLSKIKPIEATVVSTRPDDSGLPGDPADPNLQLVVEIKGVQHFTWIGNTAYLKKHGISFAKGDTVTVHGYPFPLPGIGILLISTKIIQGGKALPLSDDTGRSLWLSNH